MVKRPLYLEHFQLLRSPFRRDPDPEFFFPYADRAEALRNLLADIESGRNLVRLTGEEGTGKTLLSQVLTERLSGSCYELVCLDHPVGSFEDLLRVICLAINRKTPEKFVEDRLAELREYLRMIGRKGRRLLLVIDEAEKIYMASLERLLRLICDPEISAVLQILLIGRPALDRNLDQLAVFCANLDISGGYHLRQLSGTETGRYLRFRLKKAGTAGEKYRTIFSDEAVAAIQQKSAGSIRLINVFAEKGLQRACREGMFRVGAEQIEPSQEKEQDIKGKISSILSRFKKYRSWIFVGASIMLVLLIFSLQTEERVEAPAADSVGQVEGREEIPGFEQSVQREGDIPAPGMQGKVEDKETARADPRIPPVGEVKGTGEMTAKREKAVPGQRGDRAVLGQAEVRGREDQPAREEPPVAMPRAPDEQESDSGVIVEPEDPPTIEPGERKKRNPSTLQQAEPGQRNADKIYRDRLRATSNWLAWSYRGGYTIQLMVLASEEAEQNLKNLLVGDDYFSIRDELYILRKMSPAAIFVFYGLYDTQEGARDVLDELPDFLQKHDPYVLSIGDALQKTDL